MNDTTDSDRAKHQADLTSKTIRRIAELRIKALGLTCTVDEYIQRTQEQTERVTK